MPMSLLTSSGDELARTACWVAAGACALWLLLTTLACAIEAARRHDVRALRWTPPGARQLLRAALAGTLVVAPAPPVTLHVGGDGHLATGPEPRHARPTTTSTTTTTAPTTPTATGLPVVPTPRAGTPRATPPARMKPRVHVVRAGDNLWSIARLEVAYATGHRPDDHAIAPYWQRVIAANRSTLRSGDPSLIFPGELITLPAY